MTVTFLPMPRSLIGHADSDLCPPSFPTPHPKICVGAPGIGSWHLIAKLIPMGMNWKSLLSTSQCSFYVWKIVQSSIGLSRNSETFQCLFPTLRLYYNHTTRDKARGRSVSHNLTRPVSHNLLLKTCKIAHLSWNVSADHPLTRVPSVPFSGFLQLRFLPQRQVRQMFLWSWGTLPCLSRCTLDSWGRHSGGGCNFWMGVQTFSKGPRHNGPPSSEGPYPTL